MGSTSAGRAMLQKKVTGFADMVHWAECVPQTPLTASFEAAHQPQASRPRPTTQVQPKRNRRPLSKQGQPASRPVHTVHDTSAMYNQAQQSECSSTISASSAQRHLPSKVSPNSATPQDLYLQRLQAAALAWRTAAQATAGAQQATPADRAKPSSAPSLNDRPQSNMYMADSEAVSARPPDNLPVETPVRQAWGNPLPLQHQTVHIQQSAARSHTSAQNSGGRISTLLDAAVRWSPANVKSDYNVNSADSSQLAASPYFHVRSLPVDPARASYLQTGVPAQDHLALSTEFSQLQQAANSGTSDQYDALAPISEGPDRHNTYSYDSGTYGAALEVLPPPPPPMPCNTTKPKASWWAALKGEAPPWEL